MTNMNEGISRFSAWKVDAILKAIQDGGATWDADLQPIKHRTGYMVSLPKYEVKRKPDDIVGIVETVERLRRTIKEDLLPGITYVGLWIDDGIVYIDVSIRETSEAGARALGRLGGQKAIYDLQTGDSIRI